MSRDILESSIRAFVAKGSGLDTALVIQGNTDATAPTDPYASVLLMTEKQIGQNVGYQYVGPTVSYTVEQVVSESVYSVQFYRAGALDRASQFYSWCKSESGLNWADSAFTDGRVRRANVYDGGTGYQEGDAIVFNAPQGVEQPSELARATLGVDNRGGAAWVYMTHYGEGYYDPPIAEVTSDSGRGAVISPAGFGFAVMGPMMIRNLTEPFADAHEERAQIDLRICHSRNYIDSESGRVEAINYDGISAVGL